MYLCMCINLHIYIYIYYRGVICLCQIDRAIYLSKHIYIYIYRCRFIEVYFHESIRYAYIYGASTSIIYIC